LTLDGDLEVVVFPIKRIAPIS
jgi:hypothetical protein